MRDGERWYQRGGFTCVILDDAEVERTLVIKEMFGS